MASSLVQSVKSWRRARRQRWTRWTKPKRLPARARRHWSRRGCGNRGLEAASPAASGVGGAPKEASSSTRPQPEVAAARATRTEEGVVGARLRRRAQLDREQQEVRGEGLAGRERGGLEPRVAGHRGEQRDVHQKRDHGCSGGMPAEPRAGRRSAAGSADLANVPSAGAQAQQRERGCADAARRRKLRRAGAGSAGASNVLSEAGCSAQQMSGMPEILFRSSGFTPALSSAVSRISRLLVVTTQRRRVEVRLHGVRHAPATARGRERARTQHVTCQWLRIDEASLARAAALRRGTRATARSAFACIDCK